MAIASPLENELIFQNLLFKIFILPISLLSSLHQNIEIKKTWRLCIALPTFCRVWKKLFYVHFTRLKKSLFPFATNSDLPLSINNNQRWMHSHAQTFQLSKHFKSLKNKTSNFKKSTWYLCQCNVMDKF